MSCLDLFDAGESSFFLFRFLPKNVTMATLVTSVLLLSGAPLLDFNLRSTQLLSRSKPSLAVSHEMQRGVPVCVYTLYRYQHIFVHICGEFCRQRERERERDAGVYSCELQQHQKPSRKKKLRPTCIRLCLSTESHLRLRVLGPLVFLFYLFFSRFSIIIIIVIRPPFFFF